jgi:hypothetical protein
VDEPGLFCVWTLAEERSLPVLASGIDSQTLNAFSSVAVRVQDSTARRG